MINKVLFSSSNKEWKTPKHIFHELNKEFDFILDAATTEDNPLDTPRHYTIKDNALIQKWYDPTYVNPPYGRGVYDWVAKANRENYDHGKTIVMLLPARTDTKWFHHFVWDRFTNKPYVGKEVRFLQGRIKFEGSKNSAPFPSMIVIFSI